VNAVSQVIPVVIVVLAVAFMIVRLSRRAGGPRIPRRGDARLAPAADPTALRLLPLPGDIGLVAARELRARVRGRAFRTGTLLVLLVVAGAIVIPALLTHQADVARIGVTGPLSGPVRAAVLADGPATGTRVELVAEPSDQAAAADLRGGRVDLAVVDGQRVVVAKAATAAGSATAQLIQAVARTVGAGDAMRAAGLTPAQAAAVAGARPLPVSSLEPGGPGTAQRNATFIGLLLVVFMLTQYNAWTLTGVLEEKSSRIVEVLLATTTPARLLAGKVLGIGLAAFVQAGAAVATAVALAKATHSDALAGITPATVASALAWLILGYAFYSWVYAAAGSTASRPEQAQSLLLPLGLPVIFGYLMATAAITSGNPSAFFHVLAYLPPTAPFAMPVLVSLGAASWWQVALSAAVSVAGTVGVARAAIAVYRTSVLRTGRRVPLRELLAR
jgi:ABC-2 type transport system permease protein